ncbi:Sec34-domain-containing protein [Xylona heveae TC161]|uniref:Conserved oligomeric Golgi complex subunit 3 n=1 Tax=Xylona heveae (strain CBS 132557 / TC161) TaxID=1328760 RepID=A0A165GLB8_XYLHT|nr:Sec34-domain-containing protein [Xylona heveae TC161]KZF22330.1 Sec34-domain-containing protein [Xylona heveae TC161]
MNIEEERGPIEGPPEATVIRRAKSYSDFYRAVKAQQRQQNGRHADGREQKPVPALRSELEFGASYRELEEELLQASNEDYQIYLDQIYLSQAHLDSLLSEANTTLRLLSSITETFKSVEAQTAIFQNQCEGLLSDQHRITKLADDISDNLRYYSYLEPITRKLNAPTAGNFVRGIEFSEMLTTLDTCLDYMQAHPEQREAPTYRSRYRMLLTRALTLTRLHFVNALRDIAADVTRRMADRQQVNDTAMSALLYAKFQVEAPELKKLAMQIQKRAGAPAGAEPGQEGEYQSLMNELYTSYSATRAKLILPLSRKKMAEIALAPSTSKDIITFARSSIGYLRVLCSDEYELWHEWFDGNDGVYDFLESMCEPLYDHLRPKIIHETQFLKLCELCTFLQTQYVQNFDDDEEEEEEAIEDDQLDFSVLIHPALQDTQTRLVFRAQAILGNDIENYRPTAKDLEYPPGDRRASVSSTPSVQKQPVLSGTRDRNVSRTLPPMAKSPTTLDGEKDDLFDTQQLFSGWYPTLRTAIWLLSRIYRLVNSTVFDDLAHQIVHQTTLSLHQAAAQIPKMNPDTATPVDSQLFLIKHLLILKQQIVAFDIEYVTPDISLDFSAVANTFWELRERGGLFNPANLVRLMGGTLLPRVVENMLDAKVELDGRLRTVINEFTHGFAARVTDPVSQSSMSKSTSSSPFVPAAAAADVRAAAQKEVPILREKLDQYLDDPRTKETLVAAVREQVEIDYEAFHERLHNGAGGSVAAAKGSRPTTTSALTTPTRKHGKGREDDVWDPDTFAEWINGVFAVKSTYSISSPAGGRRASRTDRPPLSRSGSKLSRTGSKRSHRSGTTAA